MEGRFNGSGFGSITDALARGGSPSTTLEGLFQSNTNLVTGELAFNHALTGGELQFEETVFGSDSALNGVVNRSFNVFNMFIDANERPFNGLIGAPDGIRAVADVADIGQAGGNPITDSLILGLNSGGPFDDGSIGGLEGMFGQGYMAFTDFPGLLGDPTALVPTDMFNPADLLTAINPLDFACRRRAG
ncbi:MAG: hypothetical protein ACRDT5_08700 [Mycobacterium sp.]